MKTRILVLSSLVLMFGCDKVERDWSKCNTVNKCGDGFQCVNDRCLRIDAGLDAPPVSDASLTSTETASDSPPALEAGLDTHGEAGDADEIEGDAPVAPVDTTADLAMDAPAADAPRTCGDDGDCPANLPLCLNSVCVQCKDSSDCRQNEGDGEDGGSDGGVRGAFCNLRNQCVACLSHGDCHDPERPVCGADQTCLACGQARSPETACASINPATPICHAAGACVQCVHTSDCQARKGDAGVSDGGLVGSVCSPQNTCVECNVNGDCTADPARGFCVRNACVGCGAAGASACTGAKPLCASSGNKSGQCVECTTNAQCLQAAAPLCDANQCRGCKNDSECSAQAGICALDGACPMAAAIVYAQNTSKCTTSDRGQGTLGFPYCDLDKAVSAAAQKGSIVRLIGALTSSKPLVLDGTLLISGASATTAIITPPPGSTAPVVTIVDGKVTLRDLTIKNGRAAGVSASAGTLHITRAYVLNNAEGITLRDGVAFDITNTVVAGNDSSGVTLGSYTGSGPARFAFNTVVNNGYGGVLCPAMGHTLTGALVHNNAVFDISPNCITNATTSTAAPMLGVNYHLTVSSPCVNGGGLTCPAEDIDGESRPKGNACDCGADEL